jgi:nicotinamidase-related amidase
MLPLPPSFDPSRVADLRHVPYAELAREAEQWAGEHALQPAADDGFRLCLLAVDVQNTFCLPSFELFVSGRSGTGAVDDSRRLCEFVYRNLDVITHVIATLDTHQAFQIFHPVWLVDGNGDHPAPFTLISADDVESGRWAVNPVVAEIVGRDLGYLERHLRHYTRTLEQGGKYNLTIWPFHALLGGAGHALVPAIEAAFFFHSVARRAQPRFEIKGQEPLTEHYSILGPEVRTGPDGDVIGEKNEPLIERLLEFDAVVIAGEAKSHCVAWTIADLVEARGAERELAEKVYLLEDCTSPVVVPGAVDYTDEADAAFARFAEAGMHVVRSAEPIESWPGIPASAGAR